MAFSPSINPSSMLTSRMFAPFSTCSRATLMASSKLLSRISRANFFEPVIFVRSPIVMNPVVSRMVRVLVPQYQECTPKISLRRGVMPSTTSEIDLIHCGSVPQQPPTKFNQPFWENSRSCCDVSSIFPWNPPNPSGMPALG